MLSAPSQLLLRNASLFDSGKWLLVNPADVDIFSELSHRDIWGFHQFYDQYLRLSPSLRDKHQFSHQYQAEMVFDGIVIYMPKAKAHLQMLLAQAISLTKSGGQVLVVGENDSGAKSAGKQMQPLLSSVYKLDAARHCSLFMGQLEAKAENFDIDQWYKDITVTIADKSLSVCTLPGVFSHGTLDAATELLLTESPLTAAKSLLDFGCGAGVIGCWFAKYGTVDDVTLADVNALALHCASETAKRNDIAANVIACDGWQGIDNQYDTLVTNPPFHTGVKTDYTITSEFIKQLRSRLTKDYQVLLVGNRFLPYAEQLNEHLVQPVTVAKTTKFSLYYCKSKSR